MMQDSTRALIKLSEKLYQQGFDILQYFPIITYNNYFRQKQQLTNKPLSNYQNLPLPFGENTLGLLIGNTKNIWPFFKQFCKEFTKENVPQHPFDTFVQSRIENILNTTINTNNNGHNNNYSIYYSHHYNGELREPVIAIQAAADISGLAYYENQSSYLCLHPIYGPWFSLRCLIIFNDLSILDLKNEKNSLLMNLKESNDAIYNAFNFKDSFYDNEIIQIEKRLGLNEETLRKLQNEMKEELDLIFKTSKYSNCNDNVKDNNEYLKWVNFRDIPLKYKKEWTDFKFCKEQILYHYTKEKEVLFQ
ncbi:hypothetical protein ABK040_006558 [Willaertia magna]